MGTRGYSRSKRRVRYADYRRPPERSFGPGGPDIVLSRNPKPTYCCATIQSMKETGLLPSPGSGATNTKYRSVIPLAASSAAS